MKNEIKNLDDLFNKVELYNEVKIKLFDNDGENYKLNKQSLNLVMELLGLNQDTITTLCKWCSKEYPFTIETNVDWISSSTPMSIGYSAIFFAKDFYYICKERRFNSNKNTFNKSDLFNNVSCSYYQYKFTCTKSKNHEYKMFLLIKREKEYFSITKIGQYPSMIDVWGFDFDIYKKQLENIKAYSDFKKAELCLADSFVAGAYTYLRRVFEKMLSKYCEGIELKDNHVETRIKAAKDKFDERIHPMLSNLYKILSKGIHELDDDEALIHYQYLRAAIEMQLEHVKEQNDRDNQSNELNKYLSEIASKIK